jgi:predicted MFS family arabinose efflux permease
LSLVDRNILSILLVDIKGELQASDAEMGFLAGTAFALSNAIAGIPLARLADRRPRRIIIALGLAAWSLLTAGQGMARSLALLALARVGVGIGEASTGPAAHSMISDYFRPARRATAISVYTMGGHLGILIGLTAGGWLNESFGWRTTFVVVGLPGLLVALVFALTVREPVRGQSEGRDDSEEQEHWWDVVRYLWSRPAFRHLSFAAPLFVSAFYCINIWGPTFLIRVHGMTTSEVGVRLGPILGIGGALGTLIGGYACDRLSARDVRNYLRVPAFAALGMVPFVVLFLFWPESELAVLFLAPAVFLAGTFIGPLYSVALGLAKLRMRAMASAMIHLITSSVGAGVVPQVVGFLNDGLTPRFGDEAVRYSLLLLIATSSWGALHAFLAARTLRADMEASAA